MRADNLKGLEDEGVLKLGRAETISTTAVYDEKVNEKSEELNTLISTRCTTDKAIEIGAHKDASAASNVDDSNENDEDQTVTPLNQKIDEEFVTKVYIPPKPAKQPNHFVDDI
ncbi:uncharacterized protein LOC126778402 [Nymphalis io]|uniref:uncharacterized protein LOC126778402 n=1 Tax=Inachis io TaxID=171585 RepID=UPI002167EBD9|nr:uncharacterized protein LOC126778402 [Nymphalis io]